MNEYSFDQLEEQLLQNAEVREAVERLQPEFELKRAIIEARIFRGVTQKDLAAAMGTTQSAISRMELGPFDPRLSRLVRLAGALDVRFVISDKGVRTMGVLPGRTTIVTATAEDGVSTTLASEPADESSTVLVA